MKIESLKQHIYNEEFVTLSVQIYLIIESICKDYPGYKKWFLEKQLSAIESDERNILFVKNNENKIIALACLKKTDEEQKICTLYVSEEYRNMNIGSQLVEESIKWLENSKPLITISDYKFEMFESLIEKYDWQLTEAITGIYNEESKELCFNGTLSDKTKYYQKFLNCLTKRKSDLEKEN